MTTAAPTSSTVASTCGPASRSALRASGSIAYCETKIVTAAANAAPSAAIASKRTTTTIRSCRFRIPIDRSVANWSDSASVCRVIAWPTPTKPASATTAASTASMTASAWIERCTFGAWLLRVLTNETGLPAARRSTASWNDLRSRPGRSLKNPTGLPTICPSYRCANAGVRCSTGARSVSSGGNSAGDASMPTTVSCTRGPFA